MGIENVPLLKDLQSDSNGYGTNDQLIRRTGTVFTATAHIITALIGSGVLSLAWSLAQLGWIAGPMTMLCFAAFTVVQSSLLADCYRSPDPEHGHIRNSTYMDAVRRNLGENSVWICGLFQQVYLYGIGIAYNITSATSMRSIQKSECYNREGYNAPCSYGINSFMLLFGAAQILLSQIPNFHNMESLSILAAFMSFCYSLIGFALSFVKTIENGVIKGTIGGVPMESVSQKIWRVSQGLGDIAYSYPYSIILLEIQDTLKSPPAENKTIKKASMISISITTFFYLCCGCFGYAAFGNDTPGNLLTGFDSYEPDWLINFANACIVLHLLGGYQMYSQPVFACVEKWFADKFPNSRFVNDFHTIQLLGFPSFRVNLLRLCFRTLYVASTTYVAMLIPYFNQVLGVLGALSFWPLAIYFPVEMYFVQKKIGAWTGKWVLLQTFSFVCFLVSLFALVGSVEGLFSVKLREKQTWVCGLIQYASMCGTGIAYSITTPASMRTIQRSNCYHEEGHGADSSYGITSFTLLFGAAQIVLSQMPDFHSMKWLSVVAAIMSFCYSSVGLGLGFAKVIGNGRIKGGIRGVRRASSAQKVWTVSQALGDIAFSYPFSLILLEIQLVGGIINTIVEDLWSFNRASSYPR